MKWLALGLVSVVLNVAVLLGAVLCALVAAAQCAAERERTAARDPGCFHMEDEPVAQVGSSLLQLALLRALRGLTRSGRRWLLCATPTVAWLLLLVVVVAK